MLIIIIMNIIKIFSDARAMARLGPGPAPTGEMYRRGGCRILYRLFIVSRFTLDSIYLCCCSWVPIKVGIKDAIHVSTLYFIVLKLFLFLITNEH